MTWVQNVARSQGYVIVTKRSKAITKDFISKIYVKAHDGWKLRVVRDEHNHEPSMYIEGHRFTMRLSDKEARLVQDLTELDVKPQNILPTLKMQNQNNVSSLRIIYNFFKKFGRSRREGRTPMRNVMHILQTKGYNLQYRVNTITNELEDLFFIHPTSLKMWQTFPYAVLMDATYKTNKYNLLFLEIVGVTSTNKTFSIAFAFIHNEKTSNYISALTCLKLTINDSFSPRVIVTDRDLTLMKACEDVFSQSNHLLCRQRIKPQKTWNSFHVKWKKLVESPTLNAYMQNYADLQTLLFEHADVFDYLYTVWLGKYAERFVSLWTDKHINFGNSTTNRVESQHAKLKNTWNMRNVIWTNSYMLLKKLYNHKKLLSKKLSHDRIFEILRKRVSVHAMDKILEEFHRSKRFALTPENCGCQLRTCFGLPCAHELVMYVGSPIPLDSNDAFWRKLDLTSSISVEYDDLNVDNHMQRFKEIYKNQPDHIKYNYLRRME
uniref:MULE transposase domain-containing protein n=1 Tax=Lactuca sativa TaxID=4236 RepID=A0A9R1WMZ9_LACSA|nr:hypothetical protein LSAT_V11C100017390 [Lactuca sativa]